MIRVKILILCAAVAITWPARADEATESAREHYQRATSLYDVGRFGDAAQEYEAAYQTKNDPALLFNLGQAYRYASEYEKAIFAYRGYLRRVPQAENRAEVEGYIAKAHDAQQRQAENKAAQGIPAKAKPQNAEIKPGETIPLTLSAAELSATKPAAPSKSPAYKKWWVWTIVGVVAAGAAAGVTVAVTSINKGSSTPLFPAVGGQP